jgi:hypothetical protein
MYTLCTLANRVVADEITPGAVLKLVNDRKSWAWYFTFLEFGSQYIAREELWIPIGILRSGITKLDNYSVSSKDRQQCATEYAFFLMEHPQDKHTQMQAIKNSHVTIVNNVGTTYSRLPA